jgi:hypothetical protein
LNAQPNNFVCLYCDKEKSTDECSLEHGIPQFLGGTHAPTNFEFSNVCKTCNNNLGRYVDGSFARSWFAGVALQTCAMLTYDVKNPHYEVPLVCMGISDFSPPNMLDNEVCENWLGPFGESIFLIRSNDERFYWYSGGDPVEAKRNEQRAYFFISEKSPKNFQLAFTSFKSSFNRKTKKIMCTTFLNFDTSSIGFADADELDKLRMAFFKSKIFIKDETRKNRLSLNTKFDERFLCKLGLAVSYGLFGESFLSTDYASELRKGIWFNPASNSKLKVNGAPTLFNQNKLLEKILSLEGAVIIFVIGTNEGVMMNLTIGTKQFGSIKIAEPTQQLPNSFKHPLGDGIVFLLFKSLQKFITVPYIDFVAYKCNSISHPELDEISELVRNNTEYFQNGLPEFTNEVQHTTEA